MECNKDEAIRAKSIAEGKLEQNDYACAKKFALKAQSLYPGLDGISQMLTTLDVYIAAQNKIFEQVDWYGVLGVNPSADDETIKRQYKKLALMVHPDKNTSIGADGAFKLISGAWSFLSDKAKRLGYDNMRRGYSGFQHNVPPAPSRQPQPNVSTHTGGPSAPSGSTQQDVPRRPRRPSAPTRPSQQKVPRHTGGPSAPSNCASREASVPKPQEASRKQTPGPSAPCTPSHNGGPSRPSQHKGPGPSTPSNCASRDTSAPKPKDTSAELSRKQTSGGLSAPSRPIQQKVPRHTGGPSTPSRPSSCVPSAPSSPNQHNSPGPSTPFNCASRKISAPKPQDISAKASTERTPAPSQQIFDKFWTTCDQCNSQYEYLKIFRNCFLHCKKCENSFKASETVHQPNL